MGQSLSSLWIDRIASPFQASFAKSGPTTLGAGRASELPAGKREQAPALHMPDFDVALEGRFRTIACGP
jgi:hypothetical protein